MRRYAPSYLTHHGRGFYPGAQAQSLRLLRDVSAPLADDKISNEKRLQFDLSFYENLQTKMRIVVARKNECVFSPQMIVKHFLSYKRRQQHLVCD